jgi:fluoroquinolone transport system permease protein
MGAAASIIKLDLRGVRRDHVALATVLLSAIGVAGITVLGGFQRHLPGWSDWFPFIVAVSLVGGPSGFGFLFGLLMVEEGDTGVREALAVTPIPPRVFLLVRTVVATVWMAVWPLASVSLMNSTWRGVDLSLAHWLALVIPLALLTPAFALLIPALARDKVGALAVFKGLSFVTLFPLVMFFIPVGTVYRPILLASPTGWIIEAYLAFLNDVPASGFGWSLGAVAYAMTLLLVVVHRFNRKVYRTHL